MKKSLLTLIFFIVSIPIINAQWTAVNTGLPNSGTNTDVESFAVIGTNLFAATSSGVFLSANSGGSWAGMNTGITNTDIEVLATIDTNLFAGTGNGIFLSSNNGTSWTAASTGLNTANGTSVYSLFADGINLYAGTEAGAFLSSNNGTSWTGVNTGLPTTDVYAFAKNGTNLFAGVLFSGVYMSTNNGTSWTAVNTGLPAGLNADVESFAVIGANVFAGDLNSSGGGVFLTSNNGTSWAGVNTGLTNTSVHSLAVYGTKLFAGTDGGVFLSTNNGASWVPVNTGLTDLNVQSLFVNGNNLFAGTGNGVFIATLSSLAGINEIENENIQVNVFPNPSDGNFTIQINKVNPNALLEIYNVLGEKVLSTELNTEKAAINLSKQAKGIYYAKIFIEERMYTEKFVIQ